MSDLGYSLNWDRPTGSFLRVVDSTTIEGYRKSTGWAKDQRVYFVMKFSEPFSSYQLFENDTLAINPAEAVKAKIILNFDTFEGKEIVLKTGLSTANIDGAYASLASEAPHFNFERYKTEAREESEKSKLAKIEIQTEDTSQKAVFYTMLYQSMLAPTLLMIRMGITRLQMVR